MNGSVSEPSVNWAEAISAVAVALADRTFSAEGGPSGSESLLAALTGSAPSSLRRKLRREHAVNSDVEPLIYQNELPVRLLADGIVGVAAQAVGGSRVTAIVALAALSTLRLDQADQATIRIQVHRAGSAFGEPGWTQALDSLARRTAELDDLLRQTVADRRQTWRQVTLEDRILAEAVAAAVVGGAASASGRPAQQWTLPFYLFCSLAVSAAKASLTTIEGWLGTDFLPAALTAERTASLAALVVNEASALGQGCGCKAETGVGEVAYARRGSCRQADHDLAAWRPGQPKPGSHNKARYASTLWGWQRRWLGGANARRRTADGHRERLRLRSHDVASSVLARRWLSGDRGFGGPVMLYDRILPEFCLSCGGKVQLVSVSDVTGRTIIQRTACCAQQQLVYRSEFSLRGGRWLLKPKLGIIVTSPASDQGQSGYASTRPLGPLWICRRSGRYSLSGRYCPSAGCQAAPGCALEPAQHGWVLLPRSDAWADLKATGAYREDDTADSLAGGTVAEADLALLADICSQMRPGHQCQFASAADVWELAKGWSSSEVNGFMALGKRHGLELLLRCKEIAHAQAGTKEQAAAPDQGTLNCRPAAATNDEQRTAAGSEHIDQGD